MTLDSYPSFKQDTNNWEKSSFEHHLLDPLLKQTDSVYPWQSTYLCVDGKELILINVIQKICQMIKGVFLFTDWSNVRHVNSTLLRGLFDNQKFFEKSKIDEMILKLKNKPQHKIVLDYLNERTSKGREEILHFYHKDKSHWSMNIPEFNSKPDYFQYRHDFKYEYDEKFLKPLLEQKQNENLYWTADGIMLASSFQTFVQRVKGWLGFTNFADIPTVNSIVLKGLYEGEKNGFLSSEDLTTILTKMNEKKSRPIQLANEVNELVNKINLKHSGKPSFKEMQTILSTYHTKEKKNLIPSLWTRVWVSVRDKISRPNAKPLIDSSNPQFGDVPLALAKFAIERYDKKQALYYFQLAQRINNSDPKFQEKLGKAFLGSCNSFQPQYAWREIFLNLIETAKENKDGYALKKYCEAGLKCFPHDQQLLCYLGEHYLSKENYNDIEICLPALVKQYEKTSDIESLENLAKAHWELGKYDKTVELWKSIITVLERDNVNRIYNISIAKYWQCIGNAYHKGLVGFTFNSFGLKTFSHDKAFESYEMAIKKGPFSDKEFEGKLINTYFEAVKGVKRLSDLADQLESDKKAQGFLYMVIGEAYKQGVIGLQGVFTKSPDNATAFMYLEKAYQVDPASYNNYIQPIIEYNLENKNPSKAIVLYKEMSIRWPTEFTQITFSADQWHLLSTALVDEKREKSEEEIKLDLELKERKLPADFSLAFSCCKKATEVESPKALHLTSYYRLCHKHALKKYSANMDYKEFSTSIIHLEEARKKTIDKTLLKDINDLLKGIYVRGAESYIQKMLFDESVELIKIHPTLDVALGQKVDGELTRKDCLKTALSIYDKALIIDPKDAKIYFDKAQIHWLLEEFGLMLANNEKVYELDKTNPFYTLRYIYSLEMNDRKQMAEKIMETFQAGSILKFYKDAMPPDHYKIETQWLENCFMHEDKKQYKIDPHTNYKK